MRILGLSEGSHDAAWCVIDNGRILEAHHQERHSRIKNDKWLREDILPRADINIGHERIFAVHERNKRAGQKPQKFSNIKCKRDWSHHECHAWSGWATSTFEDCDILVVDAIGEMNSTTVFHVRDREWNVNKIQMYPKSLGLAYSAVTQMLGYKPMEEEYIVMGLAAYGEPTINFDWMYDINPHFGIPPIHGRPEDIAASIQHWYEKELLKIIDEHCHHENLIIVGGCALNCVANSKIKGKNIWVFPNPGDAGASLGAAAATWQDKIDFKNMFLGTNIKNVLNPKEVAQYLVENKVAGLATGRSEFGPRALGNRSLLGDPREPIKNTVNEIKRRQKFRPFSPAILEEHFDEYFDGTKNEYMSFVSQAKHDHDSVTHVDGSARVQCVKPGSSFLRLVLEEWYELTGCPMLLNTSLNIKGQPMVDTKEHALEFQSKYNVKVFV